jgi:hypothetical protein
LACVGVLVWVLAHLEQSGIKRRVLQAAASFGITVEYDQASLSLSELHVSGLRVAQPAPDSAAAPLIAIDHIDAEFSLWRAVTGGRVRIRSAVVSGMHLFLFTDDDGKTSVTRLTDHLPPSPPKAPTPAPSEPLSHLLAGLRKLPVRIDSARVENVEATLVQRASGVEVQRTHVSGLETTLSAPGTTMDLLVQTPAAGALVEVTQQGTKQQLVADLRIHAQWVGGSAAAKGDVSVEARLRHQDVFPLPPGAPAVEQVLSLDASIVPQPGQHKTKITVGTLRLVDGAGTGTVDADLVDDAVGGVKPIIRDAALKLDLGRLRGFVPRSAGELRELTGHVDIKASGIDLAHGLQVASDGGATVDAEISRLAWRLAQHSADITNARLTARARSAADGAQVEVTLPLEALHAALPGQVVHVTKGTIGLEAAVTSAWRASGKVSAKLEGLKLEGSTAIDAKGTELYIKVKDAGLSDGPLFVSGEIAASASVRELAAKAGALGVSGTEMKLSVPVHLKPHEPASAAVHFAAAHLEAKRAGRSLLATDTARMDLEVPRFTYDAAAAVRSTAAADLELALGDLKTKLHVEKRPAEARYNLHVEAASLVQVRPLVGSSLPVPFDKMAVAIDSKGSLGNLPSVSAMQLDHVTSVRVDRGAFHGESFDVGASSLKADISSHGTPGRHSGDIAIHLAGLSVQKKARPGEEDIDLHFAVDQRQPKLDVRFQAHGEACPEGHLAATVGFDAKEGRVSYNIDGELHRMDLVREVLPASAKPLKDMDWRTLSVKIKGLGDLDGVVTSLRNFTPALSRKPVIASRGKQSLELMVDGLKYSNENDEDADAETSVDLGPLVVQVHATEKEHERHATVSINLAKGAFHSGDKEARLEGLSPVIDVDLTDDSAKARLHMKLAALTQNTVAGYRTGDVTLDASATLQPDGTVRIEKGTLENALSGTTYNTTEGTIELPVRFTDGLPGLRPSAPGDQFGFTIKGTALQRLDAIPPSSGISATGTFEFPFTLQSSNRTRGGRPEIGIKFHDANITLIGRDVSVSKLNATIPITQAYELGPDQRWVLRGGAEKGAYSRERFDDYRQFLDSDGFIRCESIQLGKRVFGPVDGYLHDDKNLFRIDQLELSALGGKVSGQLLLDIDVSQLSIDVSGGRRNAVDAFWAAVKSAEFHGSFTGLSPDGHVGRADDVIDAGAALSFDIRSLLLEGRVDIIRVGRTYLLSLLDEWDPYHSNSSANHARQAIGIGYPKEVHLKFHDQFGTLGFDIATALGTNHFELPRQPMTPLLQKYAEPFFNPPPNPEEAGP